jgi:hypothetical protein
VTSHIDVDPILDCTCGGRCLRRLLAALYWAVFTDLLGHVVMNGDEKGRFGLGEGDGISL